MTTDEKIIRCRHLQHELQLHTARADLDRETNGGRYSDAGLGHLSQAAALQIELAKITDGSISQMHRAEGERLIHLLHAHNRRAAEATSAGPAPSAAASKAPSRAPAAPSDAAPSDAELPKDFHPSQFILKPEGDSLENIKSNPELVERIRSAIDGSGNFYAEFPNATRTWSKNQRMTRNVFLFGPPATGKSHLCRGVANYLEQKYPGESAFYLLSARTISSKYVGQTGRILTAVFADAAKYKFAVICMDEIEELCFNRDRDSNKINYTTHFLELLDGIAGKSKAMFMACSNYPWLVDPALLSRLQERALLDYPSDADIARFFTTSPNRLDWLGADDASSSAMAEKIAHAAAERGFSYRNLETLSTLISTQGERKMRMSYPNGSAELTHVIPLTEDEIFDLFNTIVSDYDEEAHKRYKEYEDQNHNKVRSL